MDACQANLDIVCVSFSTLYSNTAFQTLNYDLTAAYLNLIVNYMCLMILLSRVDDRKAVLGLFNAAHELQHGHNEPAFPRLGQMIIDYDVPLKKLSEDLTPLSRVSDRAILAYDMFCLADWHCTRHTMACLYTTKYHRRTMAHCANAFVNCKSATVTLCRTDGHGSFAMNAIVDVNCSSFSDCMRIFVTRHDGSLDYMFVCKFLIHLLYF